MKVRSRRGNLTNGEDENHENGHCDDLEQKRETHEQIGLTFLQCVVVISFHVFTFSLAVYAHHYVPATKSTTNKSDFAEWRARAHLQEITSYGRRPAGSYANENQTVGYLLRALRSIKESSSEGIALDIDVQRPSGTFTLDFLEGFTSHYRNVSNVVARLSSKENYPAEHSVLVNAHFDTAFGGAGASDDAVSCDARGNSLYSAVPHRPPAPQFGVLVQRSGGKRFASQPWFYHPASVGEGRAGVCES